MKKQKKEANYAVFQTNGKKSSFYWFPIHTHKIQPRDMPNCPSTISGVPANNSNTGFQNVFIKFDYVNDVIFGRSSISMTRLSHKKFKSD